MVIEIDPLACLYDAIVQLMTSSFLCNLLRSHNRGWQPGFRSTLPAVRQHQFRCRRLLRGAHSRLLHSPAGWASINLNVTPPRVHDVMLRAHDVIRRRGCEITRLREIHSRPTVPDIIELFSSKNNGSVRIRTLDL